MKPFPARPDLALLALMGLGAAITGAGLVHGEAGPTASGRPAATHTIDIRSLRFEPARLVVRPGDTVVWINRDVVPHTVASLDRSWTSGELSQNESWRRVVDVDEATNVKYFCEYHPGMRGSLEAN